MQAYVYMCLFFRREYTVVVANVADAIVVYYRTTIVSGFLAAGRSIRWFFLFSS